MKGKLYLASSYDEKLNMFRINIARKDMYGVHKRFLDLAPSKRLFNWAQSNKKNRNWFKYYKEVYLEEIKENEIAQEKIKFIEDMLDRGEDVCLLCFCRTWHHCHRGILGELFEEKGYQVIRG